MANLAQIVRELEPWIKYYGAFLIGLYLVTSVFMLLQFIRERMRIRRTSRVLSNLPSTGSDLHKRGATAEGYDRLSESIKKLPSSSTQWWSDVQGAVEHYFSPEFSSSDPHGRFFVTDRLDDLITVDHVSRGFSLHFYRAFPGILTSLGLLGTFVALLLGLRGLHEVNGVYNLSGLIGNLSGKFVTSILALGLSVLFVVSELAIQNGFRRLRADLVGALSALLPYLSPSRVLLDIQKQSVAQSKALKNISSDVVDKFATVFRDDLSGKFAELLSGSVANQFHAELSPTLEKLNSTMHEVGETLARIESQKQDSIVDQVDRLAKALEKSLSEAMEAMGRQFREALSGSTKDEFGALAEVIKGSATMLASMNAGFGSLKDVLNGLIDKSRTTTEEQMATSRNEAERTNRLMEDLITRMRESADQSRDQLTGTLTEVVSGLSERVSVLSAELVGAVGAATTSSQEAASKVLRQAGDWTEQTGVKVTDILSVLKNRSDEFDRAGQLLLAAQANLTAVLDRNREALTAMGAAAADVRGYTSGLAGMQKGVDDTQRATQRLQDAAHQSVQTLVAAAGRHDEFLQRHEMTFEKYRGVFEGLDREIGSVLETIVDRLQGYNAALESNFRAIATSAGDLMPKMAGVLKQSSDELREQLDELSDVLDKGISSLKARSEAGGAAL